MEHQLPEIKKNFHDTWSVFLESMSVVVFLHKIDKRGVSLNSNNLSTEHAASEERKGPGVPEQPGKSWGAELWDWVKTIVIAFVIMMLLNLFVFNLSMVKGQSMQPTLVEKDRLFVNKIVYDFGTPSRSDVIVLRDPSEGVEKKIFWSNGLSDFQETQLKYETIIYS